MRHRILLQTNPTWLKTGLSENGKTLLRYLYKTGRYDIAHMCTQGTSTVDPRLQLTPWKSFGSIPPDQNLINQLNSDPQLQRNASYGSYNIDNVVKEWKPTIWIGSDDIWAMPIADYCDKPWYKQINSIHHITVDSVPVLDMAYEQARKSKHYLTWAKFAAKEMKRTHPNGEMNHVKTICGAIDTGAFSPILKGEKEHIRKQFGIDNDTIIFLFVARNQLRKQFPAIMRGFSLFKKENPTIKAKLLFHTSFSEKGMGFDIPKTAMYNGLQQEDILCTYTCKACGKWWISPYNGEDIDCPHCGGKKTGITINIQAGVPANEMRYIYGICDAAVQAHSSGGLECHGIQSMLCSLPLSITNYSCGEDYCQPDTESFVYPLKFAFYDEMGTNFLKASTDARDIAKFMRKVAFSSKRDLQEIGEKSRAWAVKTFGIETIGSQWENLFASMPMPDWSSISLESTVVRKNDTLPMPSGELSDDTFVHTLYKEILLVEPDPDGFKHWLDKLKYGMKREDIYRYFIQVAGQDNAKAGKGGGNVDFGTLLDMTSPKRRGLMVVKESIGDIAIITSLFKSFHDKHKDTDLYVATDPKYFEVLEGNGYVHKLIPYMPAMEQELAMIGQAKGTRYFDYFYHPCIETQRLLHYLSHPEPVFNLNAAAL